ncbi:FHA domain-containing protein [Knoellia sp. 3-2P3]|uniref:FHA domain-containing protein n=1 Tax=unclassified Knoellia TaxID=2618719 RepID=UPI0023DCC389|nr:FHA domain-containing protein [Knoellia sp. 3-2P3]MDF2091561.1 FHA domain-containing protein [Knoellia sp. 3-2P3]
MSWGRLEVHGGSGLVHRGPDVLLVVPEVTVQTAPATSRLLALCAQVPDPTGRQRVRGVARLLTEAEPEDLPGFALLLETGDHLTVLVHGEATVSVTGPQGFSFGAERSLAWVERVVPLDFDSLAVHGARGPTRDLPPGLPLDLLAGTVPGGAGTLHRTAGAAGTAGGGGAAGSVESASGADTASAAVAREAGRDAQEAARVLERPAYLRAPGTKVPAPAPADHPAPPPEDSQGRTVLRQTVQVRRVRLSGPDRVRPSVRRGPLPLAAAEDETPTVAVETPVLVEGVLCASGHLNEPRAASCGQCGGAIEAGSPRVTRPRPALGVLVTDEGAVYTVGTDYVIGREPEQAPDVRAGRARPLVLRDAEHSTSRVHARLHLSGWDVLVADSGSANGTQVSRGGPAGPWESVYREPGTPLHPGDRVRLGKRQLLFDRVQLAPARVPAPSAGQPAGQAGQGLGRGAGGGSGGPRR